MRRTLRARVAVWTLFGLLAVVVPALGMPATLYAASGDLDPSFDPPGGADGTVVAVALQPDGKVLIGGDFTAVNGTPRNYIARLNAERYTDHHAEHHAERYTDHHARADTDDNPRHGDIWPASGDTGLCATGPYRAASRAHRDSHAVTDAGARADSNCDAADPDRDGGARAGAFGHAVTSCRAIL